MSWPLLIVAPNHRIAYQYAREQGLRRDEWRAATRPQDLLGYLRGTAYVLVAPAGMRFENFPEMYEIIRRGGYREQRSS